MRRWYCPEGWESRRLPPLGGDDGQEYGYFLPPPPLPFCAPSPFPFPFPFPGLPSSLPVPRPCRGRGRLTVPPPARERSSRLPVACEPSRPSLRPRKPEANARVASACFLEGKSTADPLGTLLQGMPVCFLHGKSTYCRQPFMQGNVVLQHFADNNFSDEARKTAKTFQKKISWRKIQKKNLTAHPMRVTMFAHTGLIL